MADSEKETNAQGKKSDLSQQNRKKSDVINAAKKVLRDAKKGK